MTAISVRNTHPRWRVDARLLRQITLAGLAELPEHCAAAEAELAIVLVGARRMAALNEHHLNHDGPTDVITFDYAGPGSANDRSLRGDIVICLEVAREQAREFGTTWQAEVVRYVIHGLLHLRGYDDLEPAARRSLKREENRIVRRLAGQFAFNRLGSTSSVRS